MTRHIRTSVLIVIAMLVAAAMVRAASGAYETRAAHVRAQFAASATAAGLGVQAAAAGDPTPVVKLTTAVAIAPGATGSVAASGKFPPGTTAALRGSAFSITDQTPGAAKFVVTVAAKPGVVPAVGYLEFVSKDGKRAGVPAVYVPGKWTLDGTAANGWTLHLTTDAASPSDAGKLDFTLNFLKAGETKPFESRTGSFSLEPQTGDTPSFSTSLQEPLRGQDPECAAITKRIGELSQAMAKGMDPKTMAEFEKVNEKYSACADKMAKASEAMMKEMQDPNYAKNEEARRDNFGCSGIQFQTAADGATTGTVHCGKNVGSVKFTGTLKRVDN